MKITRKDFLKTAAILTGGTILRGSKLLYSVQEEAPGIKLLRNGVGIYQNKGGTIGWFISDDAVTVVDSQFPDSAKLFHEEIRKRTSHGIDILFNTHHHRDHTSGNSYFKKFTKNIVATDKCVELQKQLNTGDPGNPPVTADLTFTNEWSRDLGNEKLWAFHHTAAHTGGDGVLHFQNANVVHLGDLVFNRIYPYMDGPGGCSIKGWIEFLEKIAGTFSKDTIYIFGHARTPEITTGNKKDILHMKDYLGGLLDFVGKEIKTGKSKEEIAGSESVPGFEDVVEGWDGSRVMNLNFAYDELTKS